MDDEHMQAAKIRRENRSRSFDSGTIRHSVDANLTALHSEQTTSSLRPSRRTNKRAFSESGLSGKKLGSVQGRRREIDLLRFHSPGPRLLADFNPETSDRELRKLKRLTTLDSELASGRRRRGVTVYDAKGRLLVNGKDICDCQVLHCLGCHYHCTNCGSRKCGIECRCERKWIYETEVEVERIPDDWWDAHKS